MAELFGFEIKRKQEEKEYPSFAPKQEDDGALVVAEGGAYGTFVDMEGAIRTEAELVSKYREMSMHPEVELAVDDIVNEAIVIDPQEELVTINLDDLDQPERVKKLIREEFENVLGLLEFHQHAYEVFRKWYVDGRIYYHLIIDEQNPREGIKELRYIDPRKIRKIKAQKKKKISSDSREKVTVTQDEFYIYNEKGFGKAPAHETYTNVDSKGIKIAPDSIVNVSSGLVNVKGDLVIGHLQKAIKPLNQLKSMEDSLVIYRISRAPERRIFYIDVGNLPKMKAEQYLRDVMTRFKNRVVYDAGTGEIRDDRKHMTMLEDFWLPRREGGRGTEITTLPGGQNLGEIEDIIYFQRKLYRSLNVPVTRLDTETQYNFGRATEVSRDEVKFAKFITRLRTRFGMLFTKVLEKQLILKGIITSEDWPLFKLNMRYDFTEDNHFAELRNTEIMRDRVSMLRDVDDYLGKFYSHEWVRKNILYQTDDDIQQIDAQIIEEMKNPQFNPDLLAPPDEEGQEQEPQPATEERPARQELPNLPDLVSRK